MASHKDDRDMLAPRESESLDDVEMRERDENYETEQHERLLAKTDLECMGDVDYKEEWHMRTGWVIAGSVLTVGLVFLGLVLFTRLVIAKGQTEWEDLAVGGTGTFRRPASDYILNPKWDFQAPPKVREYNWKIVDIVANPDGVFRPMLTINGLFPGPMIEANEGDTLVIEVDNQSVNATSIHFHGLFQNGTNFMDGTTGITQCPIAPKRKFRYEFKLAGQSGTYYYHGHQAVQASDGLYGPLVIHSREERKLQQIPYVSDRVIMLQDYYHDPSSGLLVGNLEPGNEDPPIPNGALMNGLNQRDCSQLGHRMCDNSTTTLPTFDLTPNANHRLRFINAGALAWFQISIDEHEFAITEADGTDLLPAYDSRMMISPAQRYSMIVNTNQTSADSFWLRASMVTHCWKDSELPGPGADTVQAIIQYSPHSQRKHRRVRALPTSRAWSQGIEVICRDMNTTSYVPVVHEPPPAIADHSYYIRSNLEIGDWRLQRGVFNTSSFRPNLKEPTLHRTVDGLAVPSSSFSNLSHTDGVNAVSYDQQTDFLIQHAGIKVVDLIIQNFDEGNHPMHLHGHKFWVLGQGHGMFPGYAHLHLQPEGRGLLPDADTHALDNLMRRDVATAEGFGWVVLRFVADNPGVWAFHCHMAWHSEAGLLMQFASRVEEMRGWEVPAANRELCAAPRGELEMGAAPKDEIWFGFGVEGWADGD